jgi:hypothetical protein
MKVWYNLCEAYIGVLCVLVMGIGRRYMQVAIGWFVIRAMLERP